MVILSLTHFNKNFLFFLVISFNSFTTCYIKNYPSFCGKKLVYEKDNIAAS